MYLEVFCHSQSPIAEGPDLNRRWAVLLANQSGAIYCATCLYKQLYTTTIRSTDFQALGLFGLSAMSKASSAALISFLCHAWKLQMYRPLDLQRQISIF